MTNVVYNLWSYIIDKKIPPAYAGGIFVDKALEEPWEEDTDTEDTHEIISNSYEYECEWPFLEIPVTKIFNKYKSHKYFHNEECFDSGWKYCYMCAYWKFATVICWEWARSEF